MFRSNFLRLPMLCIVFSYLVLIFILMIMFNCLFLFFFFLAVTMKQVEYCSAFNVFLYVFKLFVYIPKDTNCKFPETRIYHYTGFSFIVMLWVKCMLSLFVDIQYNLDSNILFVLFLKHVVDHYFLFQV